MIPYAPKWISAGSVRVRYYEEGRGNAVLLLHGLGGFAEHWVKNIGPLSNYFRVIVPDLVGFGFTEKPGTQYTLKYFSEFVKALIDSLGVNRLSIVGTSLGGGIAIQYSLLYPESVRKLVLVGSTGLARRAGRFFRNLLLLFADAFTVRPNRWTLNFGYRQAVHGDAADCNELIEIHYEISQTVNAQRVFYEVSRRLSDPDGIGRDFLLTDRLASITIPTLLIAGREDRVIPLSHSILGQKVLPTSTLAELKECGHMPYFEKPREFNKLVIDFLRT